MVSSFRKRLSSLRLLGKTRLFHWFQNRIPSLILKQCKNLKSVTVLVANFSPPKPSNHKFCLDFCLHSQFDSLQSELLFGSIESSHPLCGASLDHSLWTLPFDIGLRILYWAICCMCLVRGMVQTFHMENNDAKHCTV